MPLDMVNPTGVLSDTLHVAGDEDQLLEADQLVVTPDGALVEQTEEITEADAAADENADEQNAAGDEEAANDDDLS